MNYAWFEHFRRLISLAGIPAEERNEEIKALKEYVKSKVSERKRAKRIQKESVPYDKALDWAFSELGKPESRPFVEGSGSAPNPSRRRIRKEKGKCEGAKGYDILNPSVVTMIKELRREGFTL